MRQKTHLIRQFILDHVAGHPADITTHTAEHFGISRQAAHRHIVALAKDGLLVAKGSTRNRRYRLKCFVEFATTLPVADLEEDKVWRQYIKPHLEEVPSNVKDICQYGFTEMVNNVIDHSVGTELMIALNQNYKNIEMIVKDDGVGIFTKIQKEFDLDDPLHAILELTKGKLTTDPQRHSGEGIFFTSRMFDSFVIQSGHLSFAHWEEDDFLLGHRELFLEGTTIIMTIAISSERRMQQAFDLYSTAEGGFKKTIVPVSLAGYGEDNLISRSQAKRLLKRFEVFEEIILNFTGVETIGQAFADEIFRVFQQAHPAIRLRVMKANEQIEKMISHVTAN